jgi:hypothetical protein
MSHSKPSEAISDPIVRKSTHTFVILTLLKLCKALGSEASTNIGAGSSDCGDNFTINLATEIFRIWSNALEKEYLVLM